MIWYLVFYNIQAMLFNKLYPVKVKLNNVFQCVNAHKGFTLF